MTARVYVNLLEGIKYIKWIETITIFSGMFGESSFAGFTMVPGLTHSRMSSPKRMMLQQQAAWSAPENRTRHTRQHCDFCLLPCCNMLQYAQVLFPMFPIPSSLLMPGFG